MSTSGFSKARATAIVVLLLAIAATGWWMMHKGMRSRAVGARHDIVFNPGYQHCQRLKLATARAAMDVLGMSGAATTAAAYRTDYGLQRMQIQADSQGLDRWAAHDTFRQGLLLEIRASLADLQMALDQASGNVTVPPGAPNVPLLPALNRAERALSNYSASLTEPTRLYTRHLLFTGPVLLWWLLILLLVEVAILAWLVLPVHSRKNI